MDHEVLDLAEAAAWAAWLEANHESRGRVAADRQAALRARHHRHHRRARRGAVLRLDRRAPQGIRRGVLPAAKADAEVPADLAAALAADPPAAAAFDELGRTDRYLLILPLLKAATPAARSAAIARVVVALSRA